MHRKNDCPVLHNRKYVSSDGNLLSDDRSLLSDDRSLFSDDRRLRRKIPRLGILLRSLRRKARSLLPCINMHQKCFGGV